MLLDCINPLLSIECVSKLSWKGACFDVKGRDVSALAFRIEGSGDFWANNSRFSVAKGDVLYIPQGMSYSVEYTDTTILFFHFKTKEQDKEAEVFSLKNTDEIYRLFLRAYEVWQNKNIGYRAEVFSLYYQILSVIGNDFKKEEFPHFLNEAVEYIIENYKRPDLTIPQICKKIYISETVFRESFKKFYKETPLEYITNLRLENAIRHIAQGTSVADAAYWSGYSDVKYFSRVVKNKTGKSPSDFKVFGK